MARVERPFWIDQFPVTNAEFCRFLNKEGNRKEGGVTWIDLELSRIVAQKKQLKVRDGYQEHPVVCVSWYGAAAYAASLGKRLPTEEEW